MKNLYDAFNIEEELVVFRDTNDYDLFPNKALLDDLRVKIIDRVIDNPISENETLSEFTNAQVEAVSEKYNLSSLEKNYLYNLTLNEINGYGPITDLLYDKDITQIMVNGPRDIYIELSGKLIKDDSISFINDDHIIRTIERLINKVWETIDSKKAIIDVKINDGSRLTAVLPPISQKGPVFTIRKFSHELETVEDLIRGGTLTPYMARFLEACVQAKFNILVVGGSGSGKSTLLNTLGSFINNNERIITLEEGSELKLKQPHVIPLEVRGNYSNNVKDIFTNALNMRPDRVILGEVKKDISFDLIDAMNSSNTGFISTMYSTGVEDAINRLETMIELTNSGIAINTICNYMASALDIIVETKKLSDGKIRVVKISEVTGVNSRSGITLKEIFAFNINGLTDNNIVAGEFVLNKYIPKTYKRMKEIGINTIDDMFE